MSECKVNFDIISTGSKGNATVIEGRWLIDCGVSFKELAPHYKSLQLVFLTHRHGDHYKPATVKKLAAERPTLRFVCGEWLVSDLVLAGVSKTRIDVVQMGRRYRYSDVDVTPFELVHDVPNCGWLLVTRDDKRILYATDTNSLKSAESLDVFGLDLYLVEADYEDDEIVERIKRKRERGEYVYEEKVLKNHLSKAKADDFLIKNLCENSCYVYMHQHESK